MTLEKWSVVKGDSICDQFFNKEEEAIEHSKIYPSYGHRVQKFVIIDGKAIDVPATGD
jgi:hypothetical protein